MTLARGFLVESSSFPLFKRNLPDAYHAGAGKQLKDRRSLTQAYRLPRLSVERACNSQY